MKLKLKENDNDDSIQSVVMRFKQAKVKVESGTENDCKWLIFIAKIQES